MLPFSPSSYYKSYTFTGSFNKVYQSSAHASIQYPLKAPQKSQFVHLLRFLTFSFYSHFLTMATLQTPYVFQADGVARNSLFMLESKIIK